MISNLLDVTKSTTGLSWSILLKKVFPFFLFLLFLLTAGIFWIYFTLISFHNRSGCRHQREGSDWHFDNQEQLSEAADLCSLSGSHRQSEIRGFLVIIQLFWLNLSADAGCVLALVQLWFVCNSFCLNHFGVFLWLQTLLEDIKGDTHGSFEALLVALITPPALFDCHEVMRAMKVSVWK